MSENQLYDMFTKGKDLKYASYWYKVEKFLANPCYLVNMEELLRIATEEIITRLCFSLQCFMDLDVAYNLGNDIQDVVVETVISSADMGEEELYKTCISKVYNIISKSRCLQPEDIDNYKYIGTFLSDYLKSFIRLKEGSDIFADFLFSDSILTGNLEEDTNITKLLGFISALGPNIFLDKESGEALGDNEV